MPFASSADLIAEIRREVKDNNAGNPTFSNYQLLDWINDAVEDLISQIAATWPFYYLRTLLASLDTQNIVATVSDYALPPDCFQVIRISMDDAAGTTTFLDALDLERITEDAADGYYILADQVRILPVPTINVVDGLNISYIETQTRLWDVAQAVPLSNHWRKWIKGWVVLKCKARQDEAVAAFAAHQSYLQAKLNTMMSKWNKPAEATWKVPRPYKYI